MKSLIQTGNFSNSDPKYRGWVVGHFQEGNSPFKISDFEMKWGNHKKGDCKSVPASNQFAKSLCILVRGKFQFDFPETKQVVILENEGDYAYWDQGVLHNWEVLEDSLVLTLRWPSVPNDQK